ncbi:hypothetical protein [Nannocystis radixulma]|uniref:Clp ATPase C-terminal domain-containing protein n=1 Tax=Nannocystis radixulma TaxID=2995305 RepID=A0ABT5BKX5_9BACT|nr:hypothetical protein [Nannocystis radixulma]MDC0674805.1 hypothetical protein [Nannocystis radixulma]
MSEFASYDAIRAPARPAGSRARPAHPRPPPLPPPCAEGAVPRAAVRRDREGPRNVFDLCLQIFDAGRLTDARVTRSTSAARSSSSPRTSARASNARGAARVRPRGPQAARPRDRDPRARAGVPPRVPQSHRSDRQLPSLDEETAARIAGASWPRCSERSGIRRRRLAVDVEPEVLSLLLREGYSLVFGARPLKRTVERMVLVPLARAIASGQAPPGSIVRLGAATVESMVAIVAPPSETRRERPPRRAIAAAWPA